MKFREKIARFMVGRYGADELSRALLWGYMIAAIAALFFRPLLLLSGLTLATLVFRMFSKNLEKRRRENLKYLQISGKIRSFFRLQKRKIAERKTKVYRRCPHCKATLRLPRKKGKHTVCCPHCKKDFQIKI